MAYKEKLPKWRDIVKGLEGAPVNNTFGMKYKTPKSRQEVFAKLYVHLSEGLPIDCFPELSERAIRWYVTHFPVEFQPELLAEAVRLGRNFWIKMGRDGAAGDIRYFNAMAWKFYMQNKEGWKDRQDVTTDGEKINETKIKLTDKSKRNILGRFRNAIEGEIVPPTPLPTNSTDGQQANSGEPTVQGEGQATPQENNQ